ncbi:MAG: thioredoxin-dependent thiol peroxidase [Micavibrio aeruginosavorus]|uniref:thioredoxin-dependent peroxiredoxin n=1 Tax=Micavibrio aeruginosavorus TaxID=349221 RepID=A0A2W4ZWE3_9BACT|nr:MAG: thioredoxin-dependent thiol peroxidase [Micavibrio aeruginosavorus]
MTVPAEGSKAPEIDLPTDNGGHFRLSDMKGRKVVVYFYPKDDTSGCTAESCSFSENIKSFEKLGVDIVGISKCSVKKHDKFKAKYDLQFPLASDENSDVCERYGVWKEKSFMGRKYMGIERTTFLIGEDGNIQKVWPKVKVDGHTDEILAALKAA